MPLQNVEKEENQNVRFAARLIPVGDPTLNVKWFKNGQVIETGTKSIINYHKHKIGNSYMLLVLLFFS